MHQKLYHEFAYRDEPNALLALREISRQPQESVINMAIKGTECSREQGESSVSGDEVQEDFTEG